MMTSGKFNFSISESINLSVSSSSNTSNSSTADHPSLIGWSTTYFSLCVIAACTNSALLIAVIRDRNSTLATRILIGNLAIAALLLSVIFFPGAAITILVRTYVSTQSPNFCAIFSAILFTVQASICWAEVCIAVNRLVAICFPYHYNLHWKGQKSSILLIAGAWTISVIIGALVGTGTGAKIVSVADGNCGMRAMNNFGQFVIFSVNIIPYGIASLCSVVIFATVWCRARSAKVGPRNDQRERNIKRRLVVARAITASIIWCLICTIPLMIITTKFPYLIARDPALARWLKLLYVSEYAVNPVSFSFDYV